MKRSILAVAGITAMISAATAQDTTMSFFVTSAGPGNGAILGGLEGADKYCQGLADAAGSTFKTWHA